MPDGNGITEEDAQPSLFSKLDGALISTRTVVSTGEVAPDSVTNVAVEVEAGAEEEEKWEKVNIENTSDSVVGDASTVTDLQGVSSTTQTTVDTLVKEKGVKVIDTEKSAVAIETNGIQKVVTTTTTTVEYPDGTKQVITETNTGFTQTPKTVFNVDKSTGNTSITVQGGSSADYDTKMTTDYDSEGNKTSEKVETSGSGEGEAQDAKEGADCKADPDACKDDEFKKAEKGSFDLVAAAAELAVAKQAYSDYIDVLQSEVSDVVGFQFTGGGGSIESYVVEYQGTSGDIGLTKWLPYFDSFDLGALVLFLAALYSLFILVDGRSK